MKKQPCLSYPTKVTVLTLVSYFLTLFLTALILQLEETYSMGRLQGKQMALETLDSLAISEQNNSSDSKVYDSNSSQSSQSQQLAMPFQFGRSSSHQIILSLAVGYFLLLLVFPQLPMIAASKDHAGKPKQECAFYQSAGTLQKFILTCGAFGVCHGYCLRALSIYFQPGSGAQVPLYSIYWSIMCIYYYGQFQLNNLYHHEELCWKSFLIYHSKPYTLATLFSILEHLITKYCFQFSYKTWHVLVVPSLMVVVVGQILRLCAFFTAKQNFTHIVREERHSEHELITHGIYSIFRHPSYTGYFYFAVCGQLFIGNWVSALGFAVVLVRFFTDRIEYEETNLVSFFPKYLHFKKTTIIGIPFVRDPNGEEILRYLYRTNNFYRKSQ